MKQYVVDAFAGCVFEGNPAAVIVAERWPEERLMFQIASENSLPETAFAVPEGDGWRLRWFAPGDEEVDLCCGLRNRPVYPPRRKQHPL